MENDEQEKEIVNPALKTIPVEKKKKPLWEFVRFAILSLLIVVPFRAFVAQPFVVSGSSMVPTFQSGQYLIVDEISYRLREPKRGEVIVFKPPKNPSVYYIKRIVGLPGETIKIEGKKIIIKNDEYTEGFELKEPYIKVEPPRNFEKTIPKGEYFVMGDNRGASSDSRSWGTLPKNLIIGRAYLRLFPLAEASVLPGDYQDY